MERVAASNYSLNSTVINISQRVLGSSGSRHMMAIRMLVASDVFVSIWWGQRHLHHSGTATLGDEECWVIND